MNKNIIITAIVAIVIALDTRFSIPGIPINFGIDALIGLIPGIGDTFTFTSTLYLIVEAHKLNVPLHIKLMMVWNGFIDWFIGFIPFFGDLFDVAWKSNKKNVDLIVAHLEKEQNKTV